MKTMSVTAAILVLTAFTTQIATQEISASEVNKQLAAEKCRDYTRPLNRDFEFLPLVAGAKPTVFTVAVCEDGGEQLIVGGQPARDGEFPHMAAIGMKMPFEDTLDWSSCGGSLISERYVLTAAHCRTQDKNPSKVRLGMTNLTGSNPNMLEFNVEKFIKHEGYDPKNRYHDIALIRLDRDVPLTKLVRPACLHTGESRESSNVVAAGWGITRNGLNVGNEILMKVDLKIYNSDTCQKIYSDGYHYKQGFTDDLVCAGYAAGGKDTCRGDSGGPLMISQQDKSCIYYVVGVTSGGKGCGYRNVPSVYTTVATHLDWIASRIW